MPSEKLEPAISDSKELQSTSYIVQGLAGTYLYKIKYFLICTSKHRRKEVILQQGIWIEKLQRYKQNFRKTVYNYQTARHFISKANSVLLVQILEVINAKIRED